MVDFVAFGIILDDIVWPDGRTYMGVLGGGGPQAAFGMRLWAETVGISARVGKDLPASALEWLDQAGIDREGLIFTDQPTPRAWQLLEADGSRTQSWRAPAAVRAGQLRRSPEDLPTSYRGVRGYHFGVHPEHPDLDFASSLRSLGSVVSIETFKSTEQALGDDALASLFSAGQVFSPNLAEAASLVGQEQPPELVRRMGQLGAGVIALRMGSQGALLSSDGGKNLLHIPAVPVKVTNPVGAGNAFCGGFLAGWCQTGSLRIAGLYGAVAASFLLEQTGVPQFSASLQEEASWRFKRLSEKISR